MTLKRHPDRHEHLALDSHCRRSAHDCLHLLVPHPYAAGLADLSAGLSLFPALADRGYSLARAAGLLDLGICLLVVDFAWPDSEQLSAASCLACWSLVGLSLLPLFCRSANAGEISSRRRKIVAIALSTLGRNLRLVVSRRNPVPASLRLPGLHPRRQSRTWTTPKSRWS